MSQPMSNITTQVPCTTPCLNLNMSVPPPYPSVSQNMNHSNSFVFQKIGHYFPRNPPGFPAGPDEHQLVQPAQAHLYPQSLAHPIQLSEKKLQMVPKPFKKNRPTTTSTSFPISESKTPFQTCLSQTQPWPTMPLSPWTQVGRPLNFDFFSNIRNWESDLFLHPVIRMAFFLTPDG